MLANDLYKKIVTGGISKEEYENMCPAIGRQNIKTLRWLMPLVTGLMCLLTAVTFLPQFAMLAMNRWIYAGMAALLLPVLFMSYRVLETHTWLILPVFYLVIFILLGLSILIGVITNVEERASTIIVLLLALPFLMMDSPVRISMVQVASTVVFCIFSYFYKSEDLFMSDTVNCLCILIVSIAINIAEQNMKLKDLKNQYLIDLEHKKEIKAKELKLQENRIAIMLSQIQPHFLYNALLTIQELCHVDPEQAEQATIEFSKFLRGNMDSLKEEHPIPFEKELKHTKYYLALEKRRFGEKLNVEWKIETTDFILPPLTLQPLVENAVHYGITRKAKGGTVVISALEKEEEYQVIVQDNGKGFDVYDTKSDGRTHIGIDNVKSRLGSMSGGSLTITSVMGEGTTAVIRLPKHIPPVQTSRL